ncbi:Uncharacterized protein TPAR_02718 [Tolypocladium paradoxum]|uniref:Uncharacterized protein n=1 Tax=Tolypocladium paradoxum TaxID=94208 RepID=A0A2S4L3R4_9HYPO|nr:Uncharacterized protein TPAR_02718 [Tolypocladium paradoxum]
MKFYIVLPFLAGVALAAQQQNAACDTKPFKEVPSRTYFEENCYERGGHPSLPDPKIPSEECTGTMPYCFREYYKLPTNNENCSSTNECLLSRGIDPKKLDGHRILNKDEYAAANRALSQANAIYNRYRVINQLHSIIGVQQDREGSDLIDRLMKDNENRPPMARDFLDSAKRSFLRAFSPEFAEEINQAIQEARGKLSSAWDDAYEAKHNQVTDVSGWIRGKTEEKYYGSL